MCIIHIYIVNGVHRRTYPKIGIILHMFEWHSSVIPSHPHLRLFTNDIPLKSTGLACCGQSHAGFQPFSTHHKDISQLGYSSQARLNLAKWIFKPLWTPGYHKSVVEFTRSSVTAKYHSVAFCIYFPAKNSQNTQRIAQD